MLPPRLSDLDGSIFLISQTQCLCLYFSVPCAAVIEGGFHFRHQANMINLNAQLVFLLPPPPPPPLRLLLFFFYVCNFIKLTQSGLRVHKHTQTLIHKRKSDRRCSFSCWPLFSLSTAKVNRILDVFFFRCVDFQIPIITFSPLLIVCMKMIERNKTIPFKYTLERMNRNILLCCNTNELVVFSLLFQTFTIPHTHSK